MFFLCRIFLCSSICFLFFSCASTYHQADPSSYFCDPSTSQHAENELKKIISSQNTLSSFKGIGTINISGNNNAFSARVAFIGTVSPHRLRMTILDVAGRPHETLSYNGKRIFMMSHTGNHPFVNKKADDNILEKVISIPISPEEIAPILCGNLPLMPYDSIFMIKTDSPLQGLLLVNKKRVVQKIFFNEKYESRKLEIFKKKSFYTVSLTHRQDFLSQTIPTVINISNASGETCAFSIERYWPNAGNISPDIFTIAPPK